MCKLSNFKNFEDERAPLADGYQGYFSDIHQDLGMIQQAMGHATLQQTEAYLNSFTDKRMKGLQDNLSNF